MSESESHGHSVAAWTGVCILLVASFLICLGIVLFQSWMWIAGIVIGIIGVGAWIALAKSGRGASAHTAHQEAQAGSHQH